MRRVVVASALLILLVAAISCGDSTSVPPTSPAAAPSASADSGAGATAVGLSGVIRGLDVRAGAFGLATRTGTYRVRFDKQTRIVSGTTAVRAASLKDGQSVSIRGTDYGSYVQALVISVGR